MQLIKTSLLSGVHTFIKLVTNIIIGKVFAVYLGPAGITQLGNFTNLFVILNTTMSGGINSGVVKIIAEKKEDKQQISIIILNALLYITFFSIISVLLFLILKNKINLLLFNSNSMPWLILIGIILTAFFSTIFNFTISIFNGLGKIKILTILNISFSILLLLISIVLVSKFYLNGVIYSNLISFFLVSIISSYLIFKSYRFSVNKSIINLVLNKQFLQYTLMSFTTIASVPIVQMLIRNYYTNLFGVDTAGIWQGMVRLSENYLSVFSIVLITYFLPKYSEITNDKLLKIEIFQGYKYLIPALLLFFIIIYILRFFIIQTLYSNQFTVIGNYLIFMFIGDFFKISSWILAFLFIAKVKTKTFIFSEIFFSIILLVGTYILSPHFHIMGYVYSYILCYFLYFIFCFYYFKKLIFK